MSTRMRAKFQVSSVKELTCGETKNSETLVMNVVCPPKFDPEGLSEDSMFSKWSPSGSLQICVTNPNLWGKFAVGDKFYLDFTPAE